MEIAAVADVQISQHFSYAELTFSQTAARKGIDNTPPAEAIEELRRLCSVILEPLRTMVSCALHVDSGYRSALLNVAVGGAKDSAHLDGRAADLVPIGLDLRTFFDIVRNSTLPFDQVIIECDAWVHVSIAPSGTAPRREALLASGSPGNWHYQAAA
jgi:hypothetical protein